MQFDFYLIFTGSFIYSWLPFNENEELEKVDHLAYSIKYPALCMVQIYLSGFDIAGLVCLAITLLCILLTLVHEVKLGILSLRLRTEQTFNGKYGYSLKFQCEKIRIPKFGLHGSCLLWILSSIFLKSHMFSLKVISHIRKSFGRTS